jgi:hypothetical protein
MTARERFSEKRLEALARAMILGVRAGNEHRYTGVWVVVVEGRAFARSWNDKPTGWFQAFRAEPRGSIQFAEQEVKVVGKPVRSRRLLDAVTAAYGAKYHTKGSQKWVRGFAEPDRVPNTIEFVPR